MSFQRRALVGAALGLVAAVLAPAALAQAYPSKQITIVVAYPAGGDTDAMARLFAEKLSQRMNQPVIVDNKPGASGTIGTSLVAKAPADGHTLLLAPSTFSIAPMVLKTGTGAAYDVLNDLTPIVKVGVQPLFLVAGASMGVKDYAQFKAAASQPGNTLQYGSPGSGSPMHVLGEMYSHASGIKLTQVPYRGVAPVITDVLGGHVPLTWMTLGPIAPYVASGKMNMLAVADATRSSLAPQVPTLGELGVKDVEVGAWQGLFGPKGLPPAIVNTLNGHMNAILKSPEVIERLKVLGILPEGGAPDVLAKTNAADHSRFGKVIRQFGIQAD